MTRINAKDLPPLPRDITLGDFIAVKLLPITTLLSLACTPDQNKDGDSGVDSDDSGDSGTGTTGDTTTTPDDTAAPNDLVCDEENLDVDFYDDDGDGVYDAGEIVHTVYLPGGCSLAAAKAVLDGYGTGSGNIILEGGDSDVYLGGMTVDSGQDVDISVADAETSAVIIGLDSSSPIITNAGSLALFGDSKIKLQGFATNTAIQSTGSSVTVEGVDFDNLTIGLDMNGGVLSASDVRMTQVQDIGIYVYGDADATLSQIVMNNGLIGTSTQNAILAESAGHVKLQEVAVVNQQTSAAVIDIDAAYFQIIGLEVLNNISTDATVRLSAGTEYEDLSAQWSYFASNTIANNDYGTAGALVIESEGDVVAHNIDVLYNYSDGADAVVDLSDAANPYTGITTFTQSNVVGNTGLNADGTPIKRSYVTQEDIDAGYVELDVDGNPEIPLGDPTGFERIEYNNVTDNGEAIHEDSEGNNLAESLWSAEEGASPNANTNMYNPEEDPTFYPDAYDVTNTELLNAGNPNAQYPDHDAYEYPADYDVPAGNTGGSISAHGGPVGYIHDAALQMLDDEL